MNTSQDFSRRMVIIVRKDIEAWQITNTISHCAAYLGNKMDTPFDTGTYFDSKDTVSLPRNSQYPIITKVAHTSDDLYDLFQNVKSSKILHIAFIKDMIDHSDDEELKKEISQKNAHDLDYLGIGIFGDNDEIKALTKKFSLYK
jgi:hypothetical protein